MCHTDVHILRMLRIADLIERVNQGILSVQLEHNAQVDDGGWLWARTSSVKIGLIIPTGVGGKSHSSSSKIVRAALIALKWTIGRHEPIRVARSLSSEVHSVIGIVSGDSEGGLGLVRIPKKESQ